MDGMGLNPPTQSIDEIWHKFFSSLQRPWHPGASCEAKSPRKNNGSPFFLMGILRGPQNPPKEIAGNVFFSGIFWRGFVKCQPRQYFWGFVRVWIGNYGPLRFAWFFAWPLLCVCVRSTRQKKTNVSTTRKMRFFFHKNEPTWTLGFQNPPNTLWVGIWTP